MAHTQQAELNLFCRILAINMLIHHYKVLMSPSSNAIEKDITKLHCAVFSHTALTSTDVIEKFTLYYPTHSCKYLPLDL